MAYGATATTPATSQTVTTPAQQTAANYMATTVGTAPTMTAAQEELNRFADITTGIMGGMRGTGTTTTNVPNPTPLQTALGVGSTLAGIYGAFNPRPLFGS